MTAIPWLLAAAICTLASGFYSGSEMGLYCLNRIRLRLRAGQEADHGASTLLRLAQRQQETVLALLLGTNLANYLATVTVSALLVEAFGLHGSRVELYAALILSPLIFVVGDVVPKNWFQIDADRLMYRSASLLRGTVVLFRVTGLLWLLHQMTRLGARLAGHDQRDEWHGARGEVVGLLREGAAEGPLTQEQARMVERVMNLSTVRVGSIMIPRQHVLTVSVDTDRSAFTRIAHSHHYSRMPVLDRDRRHVVGIVKVDDVLADQSGGAVRASTQEPITLRARDSAASALVQLQRARATMAIVTDPRHGFVGIVTLKDVVEEIFGELPAW